jgi:hypothetical protein
LLWKGSLDGRVAAQPEKALECTKMKGFGPEFGHEFTEPSFFGMPI